ARRALRPHQRRGATSSRGPRGRRHHRRARRSRDAAWAGPPQQIVRALTGRARGSARRIRRVRRDGCGRARADRRRGGDHRSRGAPHRRLGEHHRPAGRGAGAGGGDGHPRAQARAALRAAHREGIRHHGASPARAAARHGHAAGRRRAYARHGPALPRTLPGPRRRRRSSRAVRSRDPCHLPHHRSARPTPRHPGAGRPCLHDTHSAHRGKDTMTSAPEKLTQDEIIDSMGQYAYGWHDEDSAGASARRGLSEEVVRDISARKDEPEWMLERRLKALKLFDKKPLPTWGPDLSGIAFDHIKYFVRSTEKQATSWEDLPEDIKETYDRLGIPEAEKQRLVAGVAAQYESEVVYHQIREDLEEQGVVFLDTDTALKEHPELFKEYFGTVIPSGDNKFSALNTAVWSGGSFVYVPKGVHVEIPLQAYFRINTENMGQFERTLIIADEGSYVHYVEGCTAPIYQSDSLHSAVVEIVVKKDARVRYTTIQNWSNNVYNLVTKRT